jgi:hypothetical protein
MTKKNGMAATTDHNLSSLVGKKIKGISMQEIDMSGDGADVCQFYTIVCTDGEKFVLACDGGGRGNQYATATLMDVDEFADMLEDLECEEAFDDTDEFADNDDDAADDTLLEGNIFGDDDEDDSDRF